MTLGIIHVWQPEMVERAVGVLGRRAVGRNNFRRVSDLALLVLPSKSSESLFSSPSMMMLLLFINTSVSIFCFAVVFLYLISSTPGVQVFSRIINCHFAGVGPFLASLYLLLSWTIFFTISHICSYILHYLNIIRKNKLIKSNTK